VYTPPDYPGTEKAIQTALLGIWYPLTMAVKLPDGTYFLAVPIPTVDGEGRLGLITLTVEAPPSVFSIMVNRALTALGYFLLLGLGLTAAVAPFGALFGRVMARHLTRRLSRLTEAADAWSQGDFSVAPQDRFGDEIGRLGARLRHMADEIQEVMHTRQALASLEERSRLARDLHDTVKQQVFATLMQLRAARNLLPAESGNADEHLEEAESLLKAAQKELGLIITELRPAALEGQGLVVALCAYLDTWSQHAGIPHAVQVQGQRALALAVEQTVYRVAQEALANVARHSQASGVQVDLTYTPDKVTLTVQDDGVGFDSDQLVTLGFGLQSMQQRVAEMDGALHIQSQPGEGTRLQIELPA
jgi:NarL family two-component system sensor histidine kinase LiaS